MPFVPLWDSLVQLRNNLLRDIGTMGRTLDAPAAKWATQILELVDLTLLSPDLRAWLDRIPALLTKALSCPAGTCPEQVAAVEMTMDILTRSLRDGFGRGLPDEHYEHIVEEVIKSRSPALVRQLAALLREIEELTVRLKDSPVATSIVPQLVLKNLEALRAIWLIVTVGHRTPEFPLRPELFAEVQALVTAIMTGDWKQIVTAVRPQLETLEAQKVLPQGSVRAFDSAARFASARTEDDLKRAARELGSVLASWHVGPRSVTT